MLAGSFLRSNGLWGIVLSIKAKSLFTSVSSTALPESSMLFFAVRLFLRHSTLFKKPGDQRDRLV